MQPVHSWANRYEIINLRSEHQRNEDKAVTMQVQELHFLNQEDMKIMTMKVIPLPFVLLLLLLLLLLTSGNVSSFRKNDKNSTELEIDGNRPTPPREAAEAFPAYFKCVFNNHRTRDLSLPPTIPRLQGSAHQNLLDLMAFLLSSLKVVRVF